MQLSTYIQHYPFYNYRDRDLLVMDTNEHIVNDFEITKLILNKDMRGWMRLYEKYAPMMYGLIFRIVENQAFAERILEAAFLSMKSKLAFTNNQRTLCIFILRHTSITVLYHLRSHALTSLVNDRSTTKYPFIKLLYFENISIAAAAEMLNMPQHEAADIFHKELASFHINMGSTVFFDDIIKEYCRDCADPVPG